MGAKITSLVSLALLAASSATAIAAPDPTPPPVRAIPYVDAHSHLLTVITPDEEIALFRAAGLAGVVIMYPDLDALLGVARRNPGFVIPSVSVARTPQMTGLRLGPTTADTFDQLQRDGLVCGFGELPTRLDPNPDPTDAAAFANPFRQRIYALANARKIPVNVHVSLAGPEVVAAVEAVARSNPDMPLILAHAGWVADAELTGRLLAAHPNLHADLSIRLDPAKADNPNLALSVLTPDGALRPEWRALIERFPDRFMFAMDITESSRHGRIPELVAAARRAFSPLPRDVEDAVAHGNIQRLMAGCRSTGN
jgi:predicted TIM-barrel fold metal-dependent hydrolase